jgi:hypothetical protein
MGRSCLFIAAFAVLLSLGIAPVALATTPNCVTYRKLVPAFATEFALEVKKATIQLTPLDLTLLSENTKREAVLLSDEKSCSISGDCDSLLYLRDSEGCYSPALTFRGKWKKADRTKGREIASVVIESRFEGETVKGAGDFRIERRARRFEYNPSRRIFEEAK